MLLLYIPYHTTFLFLFLSLSSLTGRTAQFFLLPPHSGKESVITFCSSFSSTLLVLDRVLLLTGKALWDEWETRTSLNLDDVLLWFGLSFFVIILIAVSAKDPLSLCGRDTLRKAVSRVQTRVDFCSARLLEKRRQNQSGWRIKKVKEKWRKDVEETRIHCWWRIHTLQYVVSVGYNGKGEMVVSRKCAYLCKFCTYTSVHWMFPFPLSSHHHLLDALISSFFPCHVFLFLIISSFQRTFSPPRFSKTKCYRQCVCRGFGFHSFSLCPFDWLTGWKREDEREKMTVTDSDC